ncbi:hypothetical protein LPJ64_000271 [Coemansia asiatica]|uniref:Carboxypeptidase n=1 Tax=Coemansia asiatica TaxID=1052880 RepID=A0A9W7XNB5_9FUNG|nr:hypothetical protein LPJ64_000271 [Coemansia asiatica]
MKFCFKAEICAVATVLLTNALALGSVTPLSSKQYTADRVVGIPYKVGEQPLHESYAGHITVRTWTPEGGAPKDSGKAKLFYWYFPAIAPKVEEPPLLLWIQGGPGSSSMIGLFTEMGPLELTDEGEFYRRNLTWANEYDFLVVDQPAGTGFSSVQPQANLTLDDLYPLAKMLPQDQQDAWRAKYPGDARNHRIIESPMTMDFIISEAQKIQHELVNPLVRWPVRVRPFLEKFHSIVESRNADPFGISDKHQQRNRLLVHLANDRSRDLQDMYALERKSDPYLVNSGYGSDGRPPLAGKNSSIWEKIGLSSDESGDFVNGYAANMRGVGKDMWVFLQKFFDRRPSLRKRGFYIFSESYGGKFVPAIATFIDQKNTELGKSDRRAINLRGVSIGNSLVHPLLQILAHGSLGFAWGLLDFAQADTIDLLAFKAINHTLSGDLKTGGAVRLLLFDYFRNVTGGINWYDIRQRNHKYKRSYLFSGLNNPVVRKALHSTDIAYEADWCVYYHLSEDIMRTTAPMIPYLLEKYPVDLGQGQFDFRDGVASNTLWINELMWSGKERFAMADRQQWWLGRELAGYRRSGGNLTHWTVLDAGHMSPGDQPEFCLDMVEHIVPL